MSKAAVAHAVAADLTTDKVLQMANEWDVPLPKELQAAKGAGRTGKAKKKAKAKAKTSTLQEIPEAAKHLFSLSLVNKVIAL